MNEKRGSWTFSRVAKRLPGAITLSLCFLAAGMLSGAGAFADSLIPPEIVIKSEFKSSDENKVGRLDIVQGDVILIHKDEKTGYEGRTGLPIFKNDTIVTLQKSRARMILHDRSRLTMAAETKIVMTSSIYNEADKRRRTLVEMGFGKARFLIRKLFDFNQSEFKVKTKTAILGVRGSDFIVKAGDDFTEVTALENTVLEVYSLANLESPLLIEDFERTMVAGDALPSEAVGISPEEIERMIIDLDIRPGDFDADTPEGDKTVKRTREESETGQTSEAGESTSISADEPEKAGESEGYRETADADPAPADNASETKSDPGSITDAGESADIDGYEDSGQDGYYEESDAISDQSAYFDTDSEIKGPGAADVYLSDDSLGFDVDEQDPAPDVDDIEDDLNDTVKEQIRQDILDEMSLPDLPRPPPNPNRNN